MKISVLCPTCRKQFELNVRFAGRQVMCRGCGGTIDVPPMEIGDELGFAAEDPVRPSPGTAGRVVDSGVDDAAQAPILLGPGDVIPLARGGPISKAPPTPFPPQS